jgi:hypothetical protein
MHAECCKGYRCSFDQPEAVDELIGWTDESDGLDGSIEQS